MKTEKGNRKRAEVESEGKKYCKAATAKELGLDRTTVRKYWPKQGEPEEEKERRG